MVPSLISQVGISKAQDEVTCMGWGDISLMLHLMEKVRTEQRAGEGGGS